MIVGLDHVSVGVVDVDAASEAYAALLGQSAVGGGFQLANMRLRLGEGPEGLAGLGFAVDDLARTRESLERRGVASSDDGRLDPGATHGIDMTLVERVAAEAPDPGSAGVEALDHLVIVTPHPDRAVALYGARLSLDFRLDRSNPQWGSRLLFFRCGGAVVEISADLKAPISDVPDRFSGLAWRVRDPVAAQARIAGAGFDVSEVRKGRKPGTAVFTLRSGVVGAPALIIGPERRAGV